MLMIEAKTNELTGVGLSYAFMLVGAQRGIIPPALVSHFEVLEEVHDTFEDADIYVQLVTEHRIRVIPEPSQFVASMTKDGKYYIATGETPQESALRVHILAFVGLTVPVPVSVAQLEAERLHRLIADQETTTIHVIVLN